MEQTMRLEGADRRRVESVVETLATVGCRGETLAEVAHDARNMVTALGLYCDLLEEPGVLTAHFRHYGRELRLVATASRRLVEKMLTLDRRTERTETKAEQEDELFGDLFSELERGETRRPQFQDLQPAGPIENLAAELLAIRNLLAALAGPAIAVTVDAVGGAQPVRLNAEDLTRVLVNLVKNAAEAMSQGGRIHLGLRERRVEGAKRSEARLILTMEDNGPGIPVADLDSIFASGFTTHTNESRMGGSPGAHRGLGLSITRSILEAAGGRIQASNRVPTGARFEIELPIRER
jgi:signal transduction histidine kinase